MQALSDPSGTHITKMQSLPPYDACHSYGAASVMSFVFVQRTPCLALKTSSLKRYQAFYNLKPESDDRLLAQSVSRHFNSQVRLINPHTCVRVHTCLWKYPSPFLHLKLAILLCHCSSSLQSKKQPQMCESNPCPYRVSSILQMRSECTPALVLCSLECWGFMSAFDSLGPWSRVDPIAIQNPKSASVHTSLNGSWLLGLNARRLG